MILLEKVFKMQSTVQQLIQSKLITYFSWFGGKSITQAQMCGYNHQTTSKVCHTYVRQLYVLVLLSIDFPHRFMKNRLTILTGLTVILLIAF